jgi:hypothetical protein
MFRDGFHRNINVSFNRPHLNKLELILVSLIKGKLKLFGYRFLLWRDEVDLNNVRVLFRVSFRKFRGLFQIFRIIFGLLLYFLELEQCLYGLYLIILIKF